jgi:hypothetical protein
MSADGLVVLHIDGVGFDVLERVLGHGIMPFTQGLLNDGYTVQRYRSGIPSTTPYCQAGILYGDNRNIPGFRWYDKQAGTSIKFGVGSSFKQVAHRYFRGIEGLATGGAAIAACYPGGAERTFGLSFQERKYRRRQDNATRYLARFLANPQHIGEALWHAASTTTATVAEYVSQRIHRQHPAVAYAATDVLEEIFVHDLTRYAVEQAMKNGEPVIYAGFYAYDEAAHGFGPEDPFCRQMLRHVDQTLSTLFETRANVANDRNYELIVLSDHGQTRTRSFQSVDGAAFAQRLSEWLPNLQIEDLKGKRFGPRGDALDGHLVVAASGGLANLYFKELPGRLCLEPVEQAFPGLVSRLARHPLIHFVLVRNQHGDDVVITAEAERPLEDATELLARFDEPKVLIQQLRKLNSFETAGDLIVFGRWNGIEQINFETQVGGHGSIGGEQAHPFLLARRQLNLSLEDANDSSALYPLLRGLVAN